MSASAVSVHSEVNRLRLITPKEDNHPIETRDDRLIVL